MIIIILINFRILNTCINIMTRFFRLTIKLKLYVVSFKVFGRFYIKL